MPLSPVACPHSPHLLVLVVPTVESLNPLATFGASKFLFLVVLFTPDKPVTRGTIHHDFSGASSVTALGSASCVFWFGHFAFLSQNMNGALPRS